MSIAAAAPAEPVAPQGVSAVLDRLERDTLALADASVPAHRALDVAQRLTTFVRRLEAARLRAVAVADKANAARANGALSTAAWLRMQGERPGDAKRAVELAQKPDSHGQVAKAMGAGDVS